MKAKSKPTSRLLAAVHETARDLHTAGFIDLRTMRNYDALCLVSCARAELFEREDSRAARQAQAQSGCVCIGAQHQLVGRAPVGDRRQTAERAVAEAAELAGQEGAGGLDLRQKARPDPIAA